MHIRAESSESTHCLTSLLHGDPKRVQRSLKVVVFSTAVPPAREEDCCLASDIWTFQLGHLTLRVKVDRSKSSPNEAGSKGNAFGAVSALRRSFCSRPASASAAVYHPSE